MLAQVISDTIESIPPQYSWVGILALLVLNIYQTHSARTSNRELKTNGGDSVKDHVGKIEAISAKMDHLEDSIDELRKDVRELRNKDG